MTTERTQFWGRTRITQEIVCGALAPQPASFALVGPRLSGKSTLLHWLAGSADLWPPAPTSAPAPAPLIALVDCAWATPVDLWDLLWNKLADHPALAQVPQAAAELVDNTERLWHLARRQRLVLLLDNFDTLWHDPTLAFRLTLQRLTSVATLVLATPQPLADLAEVGGNAAIFGTLTQLFLGLLEDPAAQPWLAHYQQQYPGLATLGDELLRLTGRHPYLLRKLGDSLAEVQQMLPQGQPFASHHAALIRLRLAEHARPLFVALGQQIDAQPAAQQAGLYNLLERLTRAPLPAEQALSEQTAALNWLINQAAISYSEQAGSAVYQLFSPLWADVLRLRRQVASTYPAQAQPVPALDSSEQFYEQLSKMEAALLRYFAKHSQRLVTMDQLLAEVWKRPTSSTRRVQEAIRRLRLQLEQQTPPIGAIENERGRGYRFIPVAK